MPLHLHRSNRTERLVEALCDVLRAPNGDPFAPDAVVVHSKGLERYLQHELARGVGICANVRFPFPTQLLKPVEHSPWALMAALRGRDPALAPIQAWIAGQDRRLVELAGQLGRLFDRYTAYRPDLDPLPWEAALWTPRPLELADDLPRRLAFFSVGTLPPAMVRLVGQLAADREVHLMVLAPGRQNTRAHPLLASLGTVVHDFQEALLGLDPVVHDTFDDPGRDTLLGRLQAELLDDRVSDGAEPDDSLRVHCCHGPARQVQVLRDELTALLDRHPDLHPRDIVVMAPDIGAFAPLIEATFHGQPWLPFRIADRGWDAENHVLQALLRVLELADGRLGASQVLELAELPPVQRRFGLQPDDLPEVRRLVADSGIRFGADAAHRVAMGLPDDDGTTWRFGLDRLLLGQAVSRAEPVLGRIPVTGAEGRDERARLGALADLAGTVLEAVADLDRPRTGPEWRDVLHELLNALCAADDATAWMRRQADVVLAELATAPDHGFDGPLDRQGLHRWLADRAGVSDPGAGFLAGAITFCQLVPMRAIPFRVVALLGMDDGAFPRLTTPLGFDRVAADPRPGDRTVRDDDRALFLDALLSARDHLLIFTSGHPPVPVAELLDHVDPEGVLTVTHPLQPFSPRVFDGTRPAYDAPMFRAATASETEPRPFLSEVLPALPEEDVGLDELDWFFKAPIKTLCTRRLGVWMPDEEAVVVDQQPQDLDGLDAWWLRNTVLEHVLDGRDPSWLLDCGRLPLGMPGRVLLDSARREVDALLAGHPRPTPPEPVAADLGDVTVHGQVRAVVAHAGSVRAGHRFSAWLHHLTRCAAGRPGPTLAYGHRGRDVAFEPLPQPRARDLLRRLVQLYRWGHRLPLLWFPETAWEVANNWEVRAWGGYREPDAWTRRVLGDRNPFTEALDVPVPKGCGARELADELWAPCR